MAGPLKVLGFLFWLFFFSFVRGQVKIQTPTLSLVPVITQKSTSVMCVIEDYYPKNLTVQWEVNDTNCLRQSNLEYELNAEGLYTAYSLCKVSSETWNTNTEYTCEATHQGKLISVRKNFKVKIQTPTLSLVPVITQKSTSVMCVIEDYYPKNLTVQWKVNDTNCSRQSKLEYKLNAEGLYTAYSLCKVSSETWNTNTEYTCEATHQGKVIRVKKNFKSKLTLTLKPPIERELFVNNKVVLEAVVSGDDLETVIEASVLCKVKNEPVTSVVGNIDFPEGTSQFIRTHYIFVDTEKWFDGEMVTCSIRDRGINQEIHFDKGDGKKPSVVIYIPDTIHTDTVSLVCEVTSPKLGDVYIFWKVGNGLYIKGSTSAPIQRDNSISVLSILTVSKQYYEDPRKTITCAIKHANMDNIGSPLQVSAMSKQPECPVDY
ncbi:hypothetical protein ABG768_020378 [Culter alburnus]|uniref:Ig-like domain-containing protein n=1 Tax=Culter alburnus TaxID=194366 RepID=A0AAW2B1F0_CULAL